MISICQNCLECTTTGCLSTVSPHCQTFVVETHADCDDEEPGYYYGWIILLVIGVLVIVAMCISNAIHNNPQCCKHCSQHVYNGIRACCKQCCSSCNISCCKQRCSSSSQMRPPPPALQPVVRPPVQPKVGVTRSEGKAAVTRAVFMTRGVGRMVQGEKNVRRYFQKMKGNVASFCKRSVSTRFV